MRQIINGETSKYPPRNIIDFDKEGFVKEVTEELYRRLSSDIRSCIKKELEQIVGKKIS